MDTSYRIEFHSANYFAKIIQFVVFFQQSPENYLINLGTVTLDDVCHFYLKYNTHPIWALFIPFIRLSNGLLLFFFQFVDIFELHPCSHYRNCCFAFSLDNFILLTIKQ